MRKIVLLVITLFISLSFFGCKKVVEKEFSKSGVTITLTSEFKKKESDNWLVYLDSKDCSFFATKQNKQTIDLKMFNFEESIKGYMMYIQNLNGLNVSKKELSGLYGNIIYSYYALHDFDNEKDLCTYMLMIMESENYYYTMNLCCDSDKFDDMQLTFMKYAMSIKVE